jgi:hypothetical protein
MNPTRPPASQWPRGAVWGAVIGSTLPKIIWQESGHQVTCWFTTTESLLLLAAALAAIWVPSLRGVVRFLIAVALLNMAWSCFSPAMAALPSVRAVTDHSSWGARLFLGRIFTLSGAILISFTLIGSGITRRDLFICVGNPAAPAQPIPFLGLRKPIPWTRIGPAFILVFALALAPYLYFTVDPNFSISGRIVRAFPWSFAVAILNAASEEFQFRSVLLAHLRGVFRPAETVLLTAVFFGARPLLRTTLGAVGRVNGGIRRLDLGPEHDRDTGRCLGVCDSHGPGRRHLNFPRRQRGNVTIRLAHERIRSALGADSRRRSVTRQNSHVVAERIKLLLDPAEEKVAVAAWQVPAAHPARKENVPANEQLPADRMKTKASGTMSWHFQDLELESEKLSRRCCLDQEIRLDRLDLQLVAEAAKELRVGDHWGSFGMAADRASELAFNFSHVRDVIEMSVGKKEELRGLALGGEPFAGAVRGVEQDRSLGRVDQVAVRLEDSAAERLVSHRVAL